MMKFEEFREMMSRGEHVAAGSPAHRLMHELSQESLRVTAKINSGYHPPEELRALMGELTGQEIDEGFGMFPPFYTDCGKFIKIGRGVFINAGCQFQDQGGIEIGDGALIGPGTILATLNHDDDPESRGGMTPAPVKIGRNSWLGARVTVCPGVTIGDGAIVGAGAVVTRDVAPMTVVAGVPAREIRKVRAKERDARWN